MTVIINKSFSTEFLVDVPSGVRLNRSQANTFRIDVASTESTEDLLRKLYELEGSLASEIRRVRDEINSTVPFDGVLDDRICCRGNTNGECVCANE